MDGLSTIDLEVLSIIRGKKLTAKDALRDVMELYGGDSDKYQRSIRKLIDQGYVELCEGLKLKDARGD